MGFAETSFIYENQLNIKLQIGFWMTFADEASAPEFAKGSSDSTYAFNQYPDGNGGLLTGDSCGEGRTINDKLAGLAKELQDETTALGKKAKEVGSVAMLTGCNSLGYGTMGMAYIGTLCTGWSVGVNEIFHYTYDPAYGGAEFGSHYMTIVQHMKSMVGARTMVKARIGTTHGERW